MKHRRLRRPKTALMFFWGQRPRVIREAVLQVLSVCRDLFRWSTQWQFFLDEWRSHEFVCADCGRRFNVWSDGGMWGGKGWASCDECCLMQKRGG